MTIFNKNIDDKLHDTKVPRVLHVVCNMDRAGPETMLMNYYRCIDRSQLQFDFVVHQEKAGDYDAEIYGLGGRIFQIKTLGKLGFIRYVRALSEIFKNHGPFIAVHAHTHYQGGVAAYAAKKYGISKRIVHSHGTSWEKPPTFFYKIILYVLRFLATRYATELCACGKDAAIFLFGEHLVLSGRVKIINNAININNFKVNSANKKILKRQLHIADARIIIGHVGRLVESKNHIFLLHLAQHLKKHNVSFKMLFIGDGPLQNPLTSLAAKLEVSDCVCFLGTRADVPQLLQVFDVFLFPSLYEGLPLALIEAQAVGLPCIVADTVTHDADLGLGLLQYISLNSDMDVWHGIILKSLVKSSPSWDDICTAVSVAGYNARLNFRTFMELYGVD